MQYYKGENMNKWVPLCGNFEQRDETIIFNGQELQGVAGESQPLVGEVLFGDKILAGDVSLDIEFESCDLHRGEEAGIILNFLNQDDFICAGISGNVLKYDVKHRKRQILRLPLNLTPLL